MSPPVRHRTNSYTTIVRKRTTAVRSQEAATEIADDTLFRSTGNRLEHYTINIGAVEHRGQRTPVTMTQPRGVEGISQPRNPSPLRSTDPDFVPEVGEGRSGRTDHPGRLRARYDLARELVLMVHKELWIQHGGDGAEIDW